MTGTIPPPNIADILRCFSETCHVTQVTHPTAGFSGAIIVRLQSPSGHFCLRGWPPNALPEQRILGLHRLLKHIQEQGVDCVAVPTESRTGETLVTQHGRCWQLEPWLPGTADFWNHSNNERLQSAARCLAQWHLAARTFQPRAAESEWFTCRSRTASPAVRERLARLRQLRRRGLRAIQARIPISNASEFEDITYQIIDMFRHAADRIEGELVAAGRSRFDLQPCLRDVWHDHVLFTGDDVTGLIDPNACRYENVATDLARLFGSLIEDDQQAWDIALDEYQRHTNLTFDELALIRVLDRSTVLLAGITWLTRAYIEQQPITHDTRVVARLRTIAGRLQRLG